MSAKQLKIKQNNKGVDCVAFILGTVGASLLRNIFTVKEVKSKVLGREIMKAGKRTIREGQSFL